MAVVLKTTTNTKTKQKTKNTPKTHNDKHLKIINLDAIEPMV